MSEEKQFDVFDPNTPTPQQQEDAAAKQKEYIELLTQRLTGKKLMVATPMYGGQCLGSYTKSCLDLAMICMKIGVPITFKYIHNESLIQRARNYLTDEFYRSDSTHLLFIDADISFDARDALALLSLCGVQEKGKPKYDIIGAPYPKKAIAWEKVMDAAKSGIADTNPMSLSKFVGDFAFNPTDSGEASFKLNEPLEVMETGTGFMCITKEAIETFRKKYPKQKYTPDHTRTANFDGSRPIYAIFDCLIDPESNRYLSEDYMFCQWSRKIGLHIWICPWMELGHTGTFTFGGSLVHHAQLGQDMNPSGISPEHVKNVQANLYKK
jgi:hypothetical protein